MNPVLLFTFIQTILTVTLKQGSFDKASKILDVLGQAAALIQSGTDVNTAMKKLLVHVQQMEAEGDRDPTKEEINSEKALSDEAHRQIQEGPDPVPTDTTSPPV